MDSHRFESNSASHESTAESRSALISDVLASSNNPRFDKPIAANKAASDSLPSLSLDNNSESPKPTTAGSTDLQSCSSHTDASSVKSPAKTQNPLGDPGASTFLAAPDSGSDMQEYTTGKIDIGSLTSPEKTKNPLDDPRTSTFLPAPDSGSDMQKYTTGKTDIGSLKPPAENPRLDDPKIDY